MRTTGRRPAALLLAAAAALSTACESESGASEPPAAIDLAALDTGGFDTAPREFAPKEPSMVARYFEGERLGAFVPLPSEVDPTLKVNRADTVHVFLEPIPGNSRLPMHSWLSSTGFADDTKGFVTGFAATGQTAAGPNDDTALSTSVLLFDSDASATAAAAALARRGWGLSGNEDGHRVQPARSSVHPDAYVSWVPDSQALASLYASGRFVVVAISTSNENKELQVSDQQLLLDLTDKSITLTADRLKSFQPTPPDTLPKAELDPDGMLRLTLQRSKNDDYEQIPGSYTVAAASHMENDPVEFRAQLDQAGADRVSWGATRVVRARDSAAAARLLAEDSYGKYNRAIGSPKGLPIARCVQYHGPVTGTVPYYCFVQWDRYYAMSWGLQLSDAQQRISAQYAMLAHSK